MEEENIKFIKKSIVFVITFILILLLVNLLLVKEVYHEKRIYKKEQYTNLYFQNYTNKLETKIGFFGNSQIIHGLNPEYINNSYNFAFNGNRYTEDYFILKRAKEEFDIDFKKIVLQIDLSSFGELDIRPKYINHIEIRLKFIPLRDIAEINNEPLFNTFITSKLHSLNNGAIFLLIEKYFRKDNAKFFGDFYKGWQPIKRLDFFENNNLESLNLSTKLNDEIAINYFLKTLEYAKNNEIEIYFIIMPVSNESINARNDLEVNKYYVELFKKIEEAIKDDYIVLDYYDLFINESSSEVFADLSHLNENGSAILSKKVNEELNSLK